MLAAGCTSPPKAAFLHPQFSQRIAKIHRVQVVLQSPADIQQMSYYGNKRPETNQSASVTARLPDLICAQLEKRGFESLVRPTMTMDSNAEAQAQAWMLHWQTNLTWRISTNGESGLAEKANLLACQNQADAVVLVQFCGKTNTPARNFREAVIETFGFIGLIPGMALLSPEGGVAILGGTAWLLTGDGKLGELGEMATIEVVFLDGNTGEILWADWFCGRFAGPALNDLTAYAFQTFPIGSPEPGHQKPKRTPF